MKLRYRQHDGERGLQTPSEALAARRYLALGSITRVLVSLLSQYFSENGRGGKSGWRKVSLKTSNSIAPNFKAVTGRFYDGGIK